MNIYEKALGEIPSLARQVFLHHRCDDLPLSEIAMRLHLEVATVEEQLAQALQSLARTIDAERLDASDARAVRPCDAADER